MATLSQMNDFQAADFQRWISQRLIDAHGHDATRRRAASMFAEFGIIRVESTFDGLDQLFKRLKEPAQHEFQTALGSLLREAEPGKFSAEAMKDVIALVGTTRAYSALPAFQVVFGIREWGAREPALFRHALSTIKTLQSGLAAYEAAMKLATAKGFPAVFIFDAYEIMIASRPEQWDRDLADFSTEMHQLYESSRRRGEHDIYAQRFQMMFEQLLESVSFYEIFQGITRLWEGIDALEYPQPFGRLVDLINHGLCSDSFDVDAASERMMLKSSPEYRTVTVVEREAIKLRGRDVIKDFRRLKAAFHARCVTELDTVEYTEMRARVGANLDALSPPHATQERADT